MKSKYDRDAYWIIALALLPLLFLFPYWLKPLAVGDNAIEFQGIYYFIFHSLRNGIDPLWNPYLCSGFPESGYPSANFYNPIAWTHFFLSPVAATNAQILLFYSLAGIGFYLFGRAMGLSKYGAFCSGVLGMAGGHALGTFASQMALNGAAWTGWVLAALECLRKAVGARNRVKWTMLLGLAMGLQFIAGHPYPFLHTCLFAGVYTLVMGIKVEKGIRRWTWFALAGSAVGIAFLLNMAQVLPGMELQNLSWRKILPFEMFTGIYFPPTRMLGGIIFPRAVEEDLRYPFFSLIGFMLGCYGAMKNWKDIRYKIFVFICVAAFILMTGKYTPLPELLYHIPFFNLMGSFRRYRVEFSAAFCLMAGAGLDALLKTEIWNLKKWSLAAPLLGAGAFVISFFGPPLRFALIPFLVICAGIVLSLGAIHLRMRTKNNAWLLVVLSVFLIQSRWIISVFVIGGDNMANPIKTAEISRYLPHKHINGAPPDRVLSVIDLTRYPMQFFHDFGAQNFSVLQGIHNAAGLQPVMLNRYHHLLSMDFIGYPCTLMGLVEPKISVLSLLNIKHIVIPKRDIEKKFNRLWTFYKPVKFNGISFLRECYVELTSGDEIKFRIPKTIVNRVAFESALAAASQARQGQDSIRVVLSNDENVTREIKLQAGIDVSDSGYDIINAPSQKTTVVSGVPFFKPINLAMYAGGKRLFPHGGYKISAIHMISFIFMGRDVTQGSKVASLIVNGKDGDKIVFPVRAGIETSEWSIDQAREEVRHSKTDVANSFQTPDGMIMHTFIAPFVFPEPMEVSSAEIVVNPDLKESGLYVNYLTFAKEDGGFMDALYRPKSFHDRAVVFPNVEANGATASKFHNYFSLKKLSEPIEAEYCSVKNLLPFGKIYLRAVTLINDKDKTETSLTYIDQYLGDVEKWDKKETRDAYIWSKRGENPRAWLVPSVLWLKPHEILSAIRGGRLPMISEFDPWNLALLDDDQPKFALPGIPVKGKVEITSYSPNEIHLKANCDNRCFMVLSEIYFPGWTATVDGASAFVYKTDYVLRGVLLEPGDHEITFRYKPQTVYRGRTISAITLIALGVVLLVTSRRRSAKPPAGNYSHV